MKNEYIEINKGFWLRRDEIKGFKISFEDQIDKFVLYMLIPSGSDHDYCSREVFKWDAYDMYDSHELAEISMKYLLKNKRIDNNTAVLLQMLENNDTLSDEEADLLEDFMFGFDENGNYVFCEPTPESRDVIMYAVNDTCTAGKCLNLLCNTYYDFWNELESVYKKLTAVEE